MAYALIFLISLLGFPLGFAASMVKRRPHRVLALAAAMALPVMVILVALISRGIWEAGAIPIVMFYALVVLSPQLLLWMGLTAFGYSFGGRRRRPDRMTFGYHGAS